MKIAKKSQEGVGVRRRALEATQVRWSEGKADRATRRKRRRLLLSSRILLLLSFAALLLPLHSPPPPSPPISLQLLAPTHLLLTNVLDMRFALLSLALPILISSLPLDNTDNTASLRATTDKYPAPIAGGGLPSGLRDPHVVVGKQQELFLFAAKGSDIVYYSSSTGGRVRPLSSGHLHYRADASEMSVKSWDSVGSVFSHRPPSAVEAYLRPAGKNGRLQGPSVLYSNDVYTLFYAVDTGNRLNAIFVVCTFPFPPDKASNTDHTLRPLHRLRQRPSSPARGKTAASFSPVRPKPTSTPSRRSSSPLPTTLLTWLSATATTPFE